jgi:hypothetical protein
MEEDMKEKILFVSLIAMVVALLAIGTAPQATGQSSADKACEERRITVLNPAISSRMVERVPLAPRADTLEGKTIYMVDLQWGGPEAAYSVFEEMQAWFARNMPSVKTELRRSKGGWMGGDDPELRKEIVERKAAGVIIGIGG